MAGGAKRMSAEEKRKAILEVYHSTKSVFTEKEIVTLATKAGVNSNTVTAINDGLVDDALVDKEKIGGSNYFWSFPAKKDREMQIKHEAVLKEIEKLQGSVQDANAKLADAKRGREDEEEQEKAGEEGGGTAEEGGGVKRPAAKAGGGGGRAAKLARLHEIDAEKKKLAAEIESLKENDPSALADLEKEHKLVVEAANRWTDNVFNCKSYLVKKRGMDKKEACRILGITSGFDYPEDKVPK